MLLTYQEEPCVEGTLEVRLDVVLEANILLNLVIDIFKKLFFNFKFVVQNMFVILPQLINDICPREFC